MGKRTRFTVLASAYLAIGVAAAAIGCGGNKAEETVTPATPPPRKASATQGIFDEFYTGADTAAAATPAARETRTTGQRTTPAAGRDAAATRQTAAPAGSFNFNPYGRYVVQVSSTPLQREANRLAARLKDMGFPAYTAEVEQPTPELPGLHYRVRIGGFNGVSEAQSFASSALIPAGFQYWVDRKANDNVGVNGSGFGSAPPPQYESAWSVADEPAPAQPPPPPPPPPPVEQAATVAPAPAPEPAPAPTVQPEPAPAAAVTDSELEALFAPSPEAIADQERAAEEQRRFEADYREAYGTDPDPSTWESDAW